MKKIVPVISAEGCVSGSRSQSELIRCIDSLILRHDVDDFLKGRKKKSGTYYLKGKVVLRVLQALFALESNNHFQLKTHTLSCISDKVADQDCFQVRYPDETIYLAAKVLEDKALILGTARGGYITQVKGDDVVKVLLKIAVIEGSSYSDFVTRSRRPNTRIPESSVQLAAQAG